MNLNCTVFKIEFVRFDYGNDYLLASNESEKNYTDEKKMKKVSEKQMFLEWEWNLYKFGKVIICKGKTLIIFKSKNLLWSV